MRPVGRQRSRRDPRSRAPRRVRCAGENAETANQGGLLLDLNDFAELVAAVWAFERVSRMVGLAGDRAYARKHHARATARTGRPLDRVRIRRRWFEFRHARSPRDNRATAPSVELPRCTADELGHGETRPLLVSNSVTKGQNRPAPRFPDAVS